MVIVEPPHNTRPVMMFVTSARPMPEEINAECSHKEVKSSAANGEFRSAGSESGRGRRSLLFREQLTVRGPDLQHGSFG